MHSLKTRLLLTLLTLTCLSFAMVRTSVAGKIKFPSANPTFTIEFPAKWTCKGDKDGTLNCDPGDKSGWALSILPLGHIHNEKELTAALPALAKSMADGAKIKGFKLGDVDSTANGNGISFTGRTGRGTVEGADFVVKVNGFETRKGAFYVIVTAGLAKEDKKQDQTYEAIAASIETIK